MIEPNLVKHLDEGSRPAESLNKRVRVSGGREEVVDRPAESLTRQVEQTKPEEAIEKAIIMM